MRPQLDFNGSGSSPDEGTDTITMSYDSLDRPNQVNRGAV